ncbi:MAG TPA: LuxR C-terminal-related transcriptional regulator [Streptosporangiaceae bacterium]|nr:LuxR C-terminal-related transcriptional regulator [Streptosporangiaceae bacterium]
MTSHIAVGIGNLPAEPNSFVGRERDLGELSRLLTDVRALTLCGPGGIGKTRLALRIAGQLAPGYPDGAWLVELADTTDPGMLVQRVAATLGIREELDRLLADTLADALRQRRALLILDTCEHLVDGCAALVVQLLAACPELRMIATSREPLRVRGETAWRVPPLELPGMPGRGPDREELPGQEAVRLFAERAAAARPGFVLGAENIAAVAQICRTLDGMPLAIELAAARVRALSVEEIASRLDNRFQLLASGDRTAPPRQQTLRAAVDWSYDLLTEAEQVLLRRLSVFSGWNLEMAEQVCGDGEIPAGRVLGLLAALIDKSLVTLDGELDSVTRYRLLDTIREYAMGRLAASGEAAEMLRRHRDYLLRLVEGVVDLAFTRGDPPWPERVALYNRVGAERANFRVALSVCLERGDAAEGLRMCSALRAPWVARGDVTEGAGWFDRMLCLDREVPAQVRARALMLRAELAFEQQDYAAAAQCAKAGLDRSARAADGRSAGALRVLALVSLRSGRHEEALAGAVAAVAAAKAAGDDWEEGLALATKAAIMARLGKLTDAQGVYETALEVLRDNNGWGVAQTLYGLGGLARARGDGDAALRHFGDALTLYAQIDARPEIARCLAGIGWVALSQGDLDLAGSSLTQCLQLSLASGQRLAIARGLEALAMLAAAHGDAVRSVKIEGAALALLEAAGEAPSAGARARLEQLLGAARARLGSAAAGTLLAEGKATSADEAARLAIGHSGGELPPGDHRADTRRGGADSARFGGSGTGGSGTGGSGDRSGAGQRAGGLTAVPGGASTAGGASTDGGAGPVGSAGLPTALTARELEIATLVARGLSNRGIAAGLGISPATVARHLANIFTKLGFKARAQVAAWAVDRETAGRDRSAG